MATADAATSYKDQKLHFLLPYGSMEGAEWHFGRPAVEATRAAEQGGGHQPDEGEVALKALSRIFEAWKAGSDLCGKLAGVSERTWSRIKSEQRFKSMNQDQITRISALLGIYKGLHLYFDGELADDWIRLKNHGPLFNGERPIDVLVSGGIPAMLATRQYIDAIRGGL